MKSLHDTPSAAPSQPDAAPAARPVKAIGLVSGGLDSTLAVEVLRRQGVEVKALNFYTGFCTAEVNRRVGGKHAEKPVAANAALEAGAQTETEVEMIDISSEYIRMVLQPKHGYGKNLNPCIDCRIMMLNKAKALMEAEGADFVFTGEVLGQRPMSQHRHAMDMIERETGLKGRLLRPLSAKLMEPTLVEKEGRLDREALPEIKGRSRRAQMDMAESYGIGQYPNPSGGCCQLTDANFSRKFRDLAHQRLEEAGGDINKIQISTDDTVLLGVGRHFRLGPHTKLIVGRDEDENRLLDIYNQRMGERFGALQVTGFEGPLSLMDGPADDAQWTTAAGITARYSDGRAEPRLDVETRRAGDRSASLISVAPMDDAAIEPLRI